MPLIAADDFSDDQTDTWASADVGGTWTRNGTNANWDKAGGVGTTVVPAGNGYRARLTAVSMTDAIGQYRIKYAGASPTEIDTFLMLRVVDDNNYYCGGVHFRTDGTIRAKINEKFGPAGGDEAVLVESASLGTYVAGDEWWAEFEATGTTLRLKVWAVGDAKPGAWSVSTTDATLTTGHVGLRYVNGSGASITGMVDDFEVIAAGPVSATATDAPTLSESVAGDVTGAVEGVEVMLFGGL